MKKISYPQLIFAATLTLLCLNPARAQAVAQPDGADDEVVELSPFTVTSSQDQGYIAQSAISGSRLKSSLGDLAVPITAFTNEFMQDVLATSVDDLVQYMVSTRFDEPDQEQLYIANDNRRFRIRGLPAFNNAINFFQATQRLDRYIIDRVEQSRGPNSVLYGLGSPGGIVNISTIRAQPGRAFGSFALSARSFNGTRIVADLNQPIIYKHLAVRFAAMRDNKGTWRENEYDHQKGAFLTTQWQIGPRTQLNVETEYRSVDKSIGQTAVALDYYTPWRDAGMHMSTVANADLGIERIGANWLSIDTTTGEIWNMGRQTRSAANEKDGETVYLSDFSVLPREVTLISGPAFPQKTHGRRAQAVLAHSFTRNLHLEAAASSSYTNMYGLVGRQYRYLRVDTNESMPDGTPNPNAGRAYVEGYPGSTYSYDRIDAVRLSIAYSKNLGWLGKHQVAGLVEKEWSRAESGQDALSLVVNPYNTSQPDQGQNYVHFRTYLDLDGPASAMKAGDWRMFSMDNIVTTDGRVMSARWIKTAAGSMDNRFIRQSAMAVLQSRLLWERLLTVVGYRHDNQGSRYSKTSVRGEPFGNFELGEYVVIPNHETTPFYSDNMTFSGLFNVTHWFKLIYNQASNSSLPSSVVLTTDTGHPPIPRGRSKDIGIKLDLSSKLSLNLIYFKTSADKDYQSSTEIPERRITDIWTALDAAGVLSPDGRPASDMQRLPNAYTFNSETTGYEFELFANPTKNWRVFINYSDSKTERTKIGEEGRGYLAKYRAYWLQGDHGRVLLDGSGELAPVANNHDSIIETVAERVEQIEQNMYYFYTLAEGEMGLGQYRRKLNLLTHYKFDSGMLKGFSPGMGLRYRSGEVTSYQATAMDDGNVLTTVQYGRAFTLFDLSLKYEGKFSRDKTPLRWSVQFNANNVFNEQSLLPTRVAQDGTIVRYRFQTPREFIVEFKLNF